MMTRVSKILRSTTFYTVLSAVIIFSATKLGAVCPGHMERFYSMRLYPKLALGLSYIGNLAAFSLDDLFYAVLFILFIIGVALLIVGKIRWRLLIKFVLATLAAVYSLFYLLWGFNYYRTDINQRLDLPAAKPNAKELMAVFEWLINETNRNYTAIYTIDKQEIQEAVREAYINEADFLKIDSTLLFARTKAISLSRFFAAATISGYYGPFFSEVHINDYLLPVSYPPVLAHETAHRLGVTSEAEANFYAWLVCSRSGNKKLVYSAHLYLLHYFVYAARKCPQFKELVKSIRYEVRLDYYKTNYHWMALMNKDIEAVASKVNDAYLKTNNVEEGIEDYEGVVKYVMDYSSRYDL